VIAGGIWFQIVEQQRRKHGIQSRFLCRFLSGKHAGQTGKRNKVNEWIGGKI